jgi:hypothetical protein
MTFSRHRNRRKPKSHLLDAVLEWASLEPSPLEKALASIGFGKRRGGMWAGDSRRAKPLPGAFALEAVEPRVLLSAEISFAFNVVDDLAQVQRAGPGAAAAVCCLQLCSVHQAALRRRLGSRRRAR